MSTSMFPVVDHPSSTNPRRSSTPSPSLQRGKACLSCRRRKMKCDALKPVCTPCLRGERVEDCEYTDGPRRPRTLTLEEDIARLRARVQELENPEEATSSVQLHPAYADASTSVSNVTRGSAQVDASSTISYHAMKQARTGGPKTGGSTDLHRSDFETDTHIHPSRALSIITPYVAEIGFFLDIDRLRAQGTHVLPVLRSALALWSIHITSVCESDHGHAREGSQNVSDLLSQTQTLLASALGTVDAEPDPAAFLHLIQAGILLAYYMQRIGQLIGARYYASGTWALATLLKLYQRPRSLESAGQDDRVSREGAVRRRKADVSINVPMFTLAGCARWAQPLNDIEAEERVRAFWAVYGLDRWFGAVCEKSRQSFMMDGSALNMITVPWPGGVNQTRLNAVQHFLSDSSHDFTQDGVAAMQAKASVLLGEATAVAASYEADTAISQSPGFRARFGALDALLQRCLSAAMTMSTSLPSQTREEGQALVAVHLIALAHVTLHRPFISVYGPSRKRCIDGALGVVRVLDRIGPKVGIISPVYALVWTSLCLALHAEVLRLRAQPDAGSSRRREEGEMIQAIQKLVGALSALSQRCPCRFFAANIEAVLPALESIAT